MLLSENSEIVKWFRIIERLHAQWVSSFRASNAVISELGILIIRELKLSKNCPHIQPRVSETVMLHGSAFVSKSAGSSVK